MNLTCLKSGIWQAELRVPEDVRDIIGKTRFAKSMRTRNKREAVVKAAPILEQWQSEIDLAKTDPQAFVAKQVLHNARDFGDKPSDSRVSNRHFAWLYDLPPSQASAYETIEWGGDIPLPAYMTTFVKSHYSKPGTQSEARRYILEATLFIPTMAALTRLNAQRWLTEEENKDPCSRRALKTMQKATGYLSEYFSWLQYRNLVCQSVINPFRGLHYPKILAKTKQYEPVTYEEVCLLRAAAVKKGDELMVAYIDIARFTGMRLSEIGALNSDSVELIDGIACFRLTTKLMAALACLTSFGHFISTLHCSDFLKKSNSRTKLLAAFGTSNSPVRIGLSVKLEIESLALTDTECQRSMAT